LSNGFYELTNSGQVVKFLVFCRIRIMHRISKKITVVNALGIHARAAAKLSKLAQSASSKVWMTKDGQMVDAAILLDILTLACAKGTTITLEIDDPADKDVLDKLGQMIADGFGED